MRTKTYLVRFKEPSFALQHVSAVKGKILGDHLLFLDSEGKLAALFLMDWVESWNEITRDPAPRPDAPKPTQAGQRA